MSFGAGSWGVGDLGFGLLSELFGSSVASTLARGLALTSELGRLESKLICTDIVVSTKI